MLPVASVTCLKLNMRRSLNATTRGDMSDLGDARERGDARDSRLLVGDRMSRRWCENSGAGAFVLTM